MTGKIEIVDSRKDELLNIFTTEDTTEVDLLAMSNFFERLVGKIETEMVANSEWKVIHNIEGYVGAITAALKGGFDISEMGILMADCSHFSPNIIDGLKEGIYHVGQSREVEGNFRPVILDKDNQIVKFFTLKKAVNPSSFCSDISTLTMQISLQKISSQIARIEKNVKDIYEFNRRVVLNDKFIYARDRIMSASIASREECEQYLKKADEYLSEGLGSLYSDISKQIRKLAELQGPFASIKEIDEVLFYIEEDMLMIPRYVGLRVYLLNYRNKVDEANRILCEYSSQLQRLSEKNLDGGKYTALEIIHKNYSYDRKNVDFWLEKPKQMIEIINSCETMLEQKSKDIFCIKMEDSEDE